MSDLRPVVADAQVLTLLSEHFSTPVTDLVPVEGGVVARTFAFRTGGQEYIIRFNLDKMLSVLCHSDALRFYAKSGQEKSYEFVRTRIFQKLQ